MATWSHFVTAAPRLAAQVRALLQPQGRGFGYLATVRPDGGPRVHPVMPVITATGLFCFVMDSPKRRDLERDGRYALHALPGDVCHEEAYLSGVAARVVDQRRVQRLARRFGADQSRAWRLFELHIDVVMLGQAGPSYEIWHAPTRRRLPAGRTCSPLPSQVE